MKYVFGWLDLNAIILLTYTFWSSFVYKHILFIQEQSWNEIEIKEIKKIKEKKVL